MSNNKVYIIYDGRAMHDTDDAAVFELCDSRSDLRQALHNWRGHDAALVEYDDDGKGVLGNARLVGHLREGRSALMAKLSTSKGTA